MTNIQLLAEWALRSSILVLGGAVLLRILRVKDPSIRLAAWIAVLCGSLAIPVVMTALPKMLLVLPEAPLKTIHVASQLAEIAPPIVQNAQLPEPNPQVAGRAFDWAGAAAALYVLVAGTFLLRLGIGLAMGRRMLRNSRATGQTIDGIPIRESGGIAAPVVLGIARSAIVLPSDWRDWDSSKLDAVLAHERSHIRRGDPAVQLLSAIHRALLWHSPLSWFLHRRIVRIAEEASDDAALAVARDRASYAEMLLEFIQRGVHPAAWQGVGMARYGRPEERIHRILDGTTVSRGLTRWSVVAILALASPLAYVVAVAHPQTAPAQPAAPIAPAAPALPASPAAPVSPATPESPLPPAAPQARTISRYIIVSGDSTSMSLDSSDPANPETLRARFGNHFAWFRRAGSEYVITDASVLAELRQANDPQKEVNRVQSEVNAQQAIVNSVQGKVNSLQSEVNGLQGQVNRRQDLINRIQSSANKDDKDALIKSLKAAIDELEASKSAPDQETVNRRQSQVNEEQHKVNEEQQKVNQLQSKVSAEQQRVSAEYSRRIEQILDSAVSRHKAQQLM
jgi:Zn-dependent protease with chaperone function